MSRDPNVALWALVAILVVGAAAAWIGARRADRNGPRLSGTAPFDAASVRAGEWLLVLDGAGPRKIQVIKELRVITRLGLADAKALTDRTPSVVLDGVDRASAEAAHRILADAGAAVRITETAPVPTPPPGGWFDVVLDDAGRRKIEVIKEIRSLTGLGLAEAKQAAERVPSTVLRAVDQPTATAAQSRLRAAGAAVRIVGS
ncbi:ribosomal protein L7/L12 [Glycomyces terrestris]|uniref:Ribosomal protein L7/L12 n=1 Tax=Glycomyces terrestris TaxID=2493553 RepID=A0A426V396_9ACTN|nr:ribosomal protein L7/L12 [Glycomyces terrestris]